MACRRLIFTSSDFLKACDSFDPLTGCPDRRPVFLALFFWLCLRYKIGEAMAVIKFKTVLPVLAGQKRKAGGFLRLFDPLLLGRRRLCWLSRAKAAHLVLCVPCLIRFPPCHLAPLVSGGLFLVQAEGDFSITSSVVFGSARDRTRHPPWQKNPARRSRVSAPC